MDAGEEAFRTPILLSSDVGRSEGLCYDATIVPAFSAVAARASRIRRLGTAAAVLVVAGSCARAPSVPRESPRHNVLLIVVDALRADRLGAAGYPLPTTPNIDRLAAEGVLFRNAYAHSTWTKPSMTTLFTSLYPSEHGMADVGREGTEGFSTDRLPDSIETIAERFQLGGWSTVAVVNQVHLQRKLGFAQGFDRFAWRRGKGAFELNEIFRDWLANRDERPFFAWVHYLDAHWPYDTSLPDETGRFGSTAIANPPPKRLSRVEAWVARGVDAKSRAALGARYDQEVALVDAAVGELVREIEHAGLRDRTWIVVTSDHGEGFLEHDRLKHSYSPYEEVARVPLLVAPPAGLDVPYGERQTPVGLIDLAPTLLDLAGAGPLGEASGKSLRPILEGIENPDRPVFVQTTDAWSLRVGRLKLIAFGGGRLELFDLESDPAETENLAASGCDDVCAGLREQLREFRAGLRRPIASEDHRLDEADLEELRSLGYL